MNNIGSRVKYLREQAGITQGELGQKVGLHGSNIGRMERGLVMPTADIIINLCNLFNVSSDWILFGEERECIIKEEENLLRNYRKLSRQEQEELQELIDFKLQRAANKKDNAISSPSPVPKDNTNKVG